MTRRWLGLALYAEGPSDHRFLDELLRRAVEHLLVDAGHAVDLSPVQRLPISTQGSDRATRIANGAADIQGAFHLLFVHADAAADATAAKTTRVDPGITAMRQRLGDAGRAGVGVVPVRETEAWALADGRCLTSVLGTTRTPEELGVPVAPEELEGLIDPKATLAAVVRAARPGRRGRRRPNAATFLDLIGQQASIAELSRLTAFGALLSDLRRALEHLGYR